MGTQWIRLFGAVAAPILVSAFVATIHAAPAVKTHAAPAVKWIEAWYSPPLPPTATVSPGDVRNFARQTVRQVVRLESGGRRVRVRFTNELGLTPVKIGSVHVALSSPNGVTDPDTDHVLTFEGLREVEIPVGKALVSDPIDMSVRPFADLAISIYYPTRLAPAAHMAPVRISAKGDHGAEPLWPGASQGRAPALASGVEVETSAARKVLVAFGDSITEGAGATPGTNMDWPEQLARRLDPGGAGKGWVVINSGISGNRLLHEGTGPAALDRFDRDVLDITGVSAIVVTEGINDIGWAFDPDGDTGPVTVADIIGVYKELIARAHSHDLKIYGGTLTPYEDAPYYHPDGETVRLAVNEWIRTSGAFDGVVDFEQAVRDPRHPVRFLGARQSGDSLHPNDAGYRAMAEAVDLKFLK